MQLDINVTSIAKDVYNTLNSVDDDFTVYAVNVADSIVDETIEIIKNSIIIYNNITHSKHIAAIAKIIDELKQNEELQDAFEQLKNIDTISDIVALYTVISIIVNAIVKVTRDMDIDIDADVKKCCSLL